MWMPKACNNFFIGSTSKSFTAAAVFVAIDEGILTLDDPVNQWIDKSITDKVANANESTIKNLLAHTSGIPDFYTLQLELDRINNVYNDWRKEDVLEYTYGESATHEVGEQYQYSNTNFLLLAMILEKAYNMPFKEVYQQKVFTPLGLISACYDPENIVKEGIVKGYAEIYGNGQLAESEFLYKDELGIGGDGGISANVFDIGIFFERLIKGDLVSDSSLAQMQDWFDIPEIYASPPFNHASNGFGLERYNTAYGTAIGHTGGIDGFECFVFYYPEEDMTFVLSISSSSESDAVINIIEETLAVMFE